LWFHGYRTVLHVTYLRRHRHTVVRHFATISILCFVLISFNVGHNSLML
jgi:hypothetical protein